jgi:hypothetical protein
MYLPMTFETNCVGGAWNSSGSRVARVGVVIVLLNVGGVMPLDPQKPSRTGQKTFLLDYETRS